MQCGGAEERTEGRGEEVREWRKVEARRSRWDLILKTYHHLPSGPHWTEKSEYHPSYATQLRPP